MESNINRYDLRPGDRVYLNNYSKHRGMIGTIIEIFDSPDIPAKFIIDEIPEGSCKSDCCKVGQEASFFPYKFSFIPVQLKIWNVT